LRVEKQFVDKRPNTRIEISEQGRKSVRGHWKKPEPLGDKAREWTPR
jgi:hypothetical protein